MKCLIIKFKETPIIVTELTELEPLDFLQKKKQASENLQKIIQVYDITIDTLQKEIDDLKKDVKKLKGED